MHITDLIKLINERKGNKTYYAISKETGLQQTVISRILKGKTPNPSYDAITKIAGSVGLIVSFTEDSGFPKLLRAIIVPKSEDNDSV